MPEGTHLIQAFSSDPLSLEIKNPIRQIEGPKKVKFKLLILPKEEVQVQTYDLFMLVNGTPT